MKTKREPPTRRGDRRRRPDRAARTTVRRPADTPPSRRGRPRGATAPPPGRDPRPPRSGPQTAPTPRRTVGPTPPKNTNQAKARAKARKAKAPKVVRPPLRERLIMRLAVIFKVDLRPRTLAAKVPFVVLVIGSLGVGLGITLWLSTDAAERSYQLGSIRQKNQALLQQKEALERDVLEAQSAPALAEAARNLGMIPSRDTAHLVQDPTGNWVVVGSPKPAEGAPPPPLNTKLPEDQPAPPAPPAPSVEVPVRVSPGTGTPASPAIPGSPAPGPQVLLRSPDGTMTLGIQHLPAGVGPTAPGAADGPVTGLPPGPAPAVLSPPATGAPARAGVEQFNPPVPSPPPATPGGAE